MCTICSMDTTSFYYILQPNIIPFVFFVTNILIQYVYMYGCLFILVNGFISYANRSLYSNDRTSYRMHTVILYDTNTILSIVAMHIPQKKYIPMSYYIYLKYVELFYYYYYTILSLYSDLAVVVKFSSIHEKVKVHFRFRTKIFFSSKKWRKRKSDENNFFRFMPTNYK